MARLTVDFNAKLALITMICYITHKLKEKNPAIDHYTILKKIEKDSIIDDEDLKELASLCDDFGYGCNDFPTFGLKEKEMVPKIKEILNHLLPF